ncbi:conserved hypothetical protein [Rubrobacter xylanophilus DSM 9941]|uniref:Phosphate-starvation-inducible E n=1 Tax=Rubrobacter xylanophilus (strain DSM 9941 / JCM 11954 / NBRC 16129 / PRD-1) TaxID=266117 RepID=Q1AXB1_RUBXD|nr:phosphate-starvation-inducible PsiE family protein [Rubrobacter xylanophilus]ABG03967.1 conserved hypothetical protein [Rubrobacter xylanophilus DSM 9941]
MSEGERRFAFTGYVRLAGRAVYYAAAVFLLATIALLFASAVAALLRAPEAGLLDTALTILDRVLLIFIFVELLNTVEIVVREAEISAEPFILIGLIAAVRRILTVTAEIEQSLGTPAFQDLVLELGVLTLLVVALSGALFFTRRLGSGG